jgi:DNA-binding beta-propeller fold protein YncE
MHQRCVFQIAAAASVLASGIAAIGSPPKIYWAQGYGDQIRRADLAGTDSETLIQWPEANQPVAVAVDSVNGKIYWAQGHQDRILRADLNGSNVELLLQGPPVTDPVAIAVDPAGKLYWAQSYAYRIGRADLNGLNPETLLEYPDVLAPPVALALDPAAGKLYWAQTTGPGALDDQVLRADLTGTNMQVILSYPQVVDPVALAVDGIGGFVYWAQTSGVGAYDERVFRAALTGGATVELLLLYPQLLDPVALAVDPVGGHIYWAQSSGPGGFDDMILRAALTGGDTVETVLQWPRVEDPAGIALGVECVTAAHCDDGNVCTDEVCNAGVCVYTNNTAGCDDGLFCTMTDVCAGGVCGGSGDPCPPLFCDEVKDACVECLTSTDCTGGLFCIDGVCAPCPPPVVEVEGPRCFTVTPVEGVPEVGLRVTGVEPEVSCVDGYALSEGRVFEGGIMYFQPPGPDGWGTVYVHGERIMAGRTYEIRTDCDPANPGTNLSEPASDTLWRWSDVDHNGTVDILDATRILDAFRGMYHTLPCTTDADCINPPVPPYYSCDLTVGRCLWVTLQNVDIIGVGYDDCTPDGTASILDVTVCLDAFRGFPDPCAVSCP